MKTIEERAKEYSISCFPNMLDMQLACEMHFEAGAEWMQEKLMRWHDPKEELPKKHHRVLLKVRKNSYAFIEMGTLQATDDGVRFIFSDCNDCEVIGWREIHEE